MSDTQDSGAGFKTTASDTFSRARWLLIQTLLVLVVVMQLGMSQCVMAAAEPLPGRLTGTYLQLWAEHGEWTEDDWRQLFNHLRDLELAQLVVQWSLFENLAFFPTEVYEPVTYPPLEMILSLADEVGMRVFVGLAHDESFGTRIDKEPDLLDVYLQRVKVPSLAVAREVKKLVEDHRSFEGWYISQEIDDVHWLEPSKRKVLFEHLKSLSAQLRQETPGAKVAISGFSNAQADPKALGRFWAQLVSSGMDVVLFQDGIGVHKLDLGHLPLYLSALKEAVEMEECDFWVVVENFRQVGGPPIDDESFKAVPASLARLARQLRVAAAHTTGGLIAFSVPEYMTPLGGKDAEKLFNAYLGRLKQSRK